MKLEIILYGLQERIQLEILTENRLDYHIQMILNSILFNFKKEFQQVRKLNLENSYLYFNVEHN